MSLQRMGRFATGGLPTLLRPASLKVSAFMPGQSDPERGAVKVWVNAVWVAKTRGGVATSFGTLWAVVPSGRGEGVGLECFLEHYQPRHFDEGADRVVRYEAGRSIVRGHRSGGPSERGRRPVHPARARALLARAAQVHDAVLADPKAPLVPDGWEGWYALRP